jgi:hypothetical protein
MYLTYEQYQSYGGTLDKTTFENYEFEARSLVDWYTFNRLKNQTSYSEGVTRCMYKLIDLAYTKSQALSVGQDVNTGNVNAAIASQSNDGFSTTFNVLSASQAFDLVKNEIQSVIHRSLTHEVNELGQNLLYRGLYPNE